MKISAFVDANVLYPAPIRDLLLNFAEDELFLPRWSEKVQQEWVNNLLSNRPDLDSKRLSRTIKLMNEAFPEALIENFESQIDKLSLPDLKDRHVLAATMKSGATIIVTANLKDFPKSVLGNYGIEAIHPDDFALKLIISHPSVSLQSFSRMVSVLRNPPQSFREVLNTLHACGLTKTSFVLGKLLTEG
jgi:hypothetical protein